ncbi:DUF47 domain-containing protein [Sporomusa termitida]|uniref:TIGR00153: family protein n=1 Tax=Sporomusa termitida TaxID=2377 RepID=A0A517DQT7_9FIRM|nr:DUF47 family protein [Sporomusa termitida]QDR79724.1 TIGR00153: family protein [Sporomusa termitida]
MGLPFKLKSKEEKYCRHLRENTKEIKNATAILFEALDNPLAVADIMSRMDAVEEQADKVTGRIMALLEKAFVTPFDREDIYTLAQKLDDIVDHIKETVECLALYNVGPAPAGAMELAVLIAKAGRQLDKAMGQLPKLKSQRDKIEARCKRIAGLEEQGDKIYRQEMVRLFGQVKDPIELIKWKEILLHLEDTLDLCEKVSKLIQGIILKYA